MVTLKKNLQAELGKDVQGLPCSGDLIIEICALFINSFKNSFSFNNLKKARKQAGEQAR